MWIYPLAILAPVLALLLRWGLVAATDGPLPHYITFYPAVMTVALFAGLGHALRYCGLLPLSFAAYQRATDAALGHWRSTRKPLTCGLTPQLVGLEGKQVEVTEIDGSQRRFYVGKSTGWMPCHLEIDHRR